MSPAEGGPAVAVGTALALPPCRQDRPESTVFRAAVLGHSYPPDSCHSGRGRKRRPEGRRQRGRRVAGGDILSMIFVKSENGVAVVQVAGGNGNPLQYSCLENPMDRGAWRAAAHGVTKGQTRLKRLSTARPGVQAPTARPGVWCGCAADTSCIAECVQFSALHQTQEPHQPFSKQHP